MHLYRVRLLESVVIISNTTSRTSLPSLYGAQVYIVFAKITGPCCIRAPARKQQGPVYRGQELTERPTKEGDHYIAPVNIKKMNDGHNDAEGRNQLYDNYSQQQHSVTAKKSMM
jgi:hypothetical protein